MSISRPRAIAALVLAAGALTGDLTTPADAGVITVRNKSKMAFTLSDLIVWGKDGKQQVIKKPGFDEESSKDDEELKPEDERIFVTDFDVVKYFVSTKIGSTEIEWKVTVAVSLVSAVAQMVDPRTGTGLNGELFGAEGAHLEFPQGQMLTFENGFSPDAPGWFVGTAADPTTGEILEPYTGPAQIVSGGVSVEYGPSPCGPDCDHDGKLNIRDFICMKGQWDARTAYGDYNHDGKWNVRDFIDFQSDFNKGCGK